MKLRSLLILAVVLISSGLEARQVGNINSDEATIERVTITYDGRLAAWDKKGYLLDGWPVKLSGREFTMAPALFDIDMDEEKDVLAVAETEEGGQEFHVFNGKGIELGYLSFSIKPSGEKVTGVPIVVDVTGDGIYEISYGLKNGEIKVLRPDFVPASSFQGLSIGGEPVVYAKDTNNDGIAELFAGNDTKIYRWDSPDTRVELFSASGGTTIKGDISFFDLDQDRQYEILFSTSDNHIHIINYAATPILDIEVDGEKIVGPPVPADVDLDGEWEALAPTNAQKLRAFELGYLIGRKAADPSYKANEEAYVASWDYTVSYRSSNIPTIDTVADDTYIGSFMSAVGYDQSIVYRSKIGYSALEYGEFAHQYDLHAQLQLVDFVKITDMISHPAVFTPNGDGMNDTVKMSYRLNMPAEISLVITDLRHQPIATVVSGIVQQKGENSLVWNGILPDGMPASTGNYIGAIKAKNADGVITTANANIIVNGIKAQIEKPYDPNTTDSAYPKIYGIASVEGVAIDPNIGEGNDNADFISYNLYYRPGVGRVRGEEALAAGTSDEWKPLFVPLANQCNKSNYYLPKDSRYPFSNVSCRPVQHGLLGYFNTKSIPNGFYTILLKALDSNSNDPARISYDTVSVHIQNPSEALPYDAGDPYAMNNPANPVYKDPAVESSVVMAGPAISRENPSIDVTFSVNETSSVQIIVHRSDPTCQETGPVVFVKEFDKTAKGESVDFQWDGVTPLGRHVTGGWYKMVVIATAVDGSGYTQVDSKCFEVEMGFASSDILEIDKFEATPAELMLAGNIDINGNPEHVSLYYELSRYANATIALFNEDPAEHLDDINWKKEHLVKLIVKESFSLDETLAWYGERANGSLVTDLNEVYALLTAESVDSGNQDTRYAVLRIPVKRPQVNSGVAASVSSLTGEKEGAGYKTVTKTSGNRNLAGDPSFYWLAWGKGRVDLEFAYSFGGTSKGERFAPCNNTVSKTTVTACGPPDVCGGDKKDCSSPPPHAFTAYADMDVDSTCQVETFGISLTEGANVTFEDMSFIPQLIQKKRRIPNPECKSNGYSGCQGIIKNGRYYVPPPTIEQPAYLLVYPRLENTTLWNYTRDGNSIQSPDRGALSIYDMFYRNTQIDPENRSTRQPRKLKYRAWVYGTDGNYEQIGCVPTGVSISNCASDPNVDDDPFNDVDDQGNLRYSQPPATPQSRIGQDTGYEGLEYRCGYISPYFTGRRRTSPSCAVKGLKEVVSFF